MCMVEDAEPMEFCSQVVRRNRRDGRICDECGRTIGVGEIYERMAGKWDGAFDSSATCPHCIAARAWLIRECGGFCWSGVYADLYEHRREAVETPGLGRLLVGMRRKWRGFKKRLLLPVPKVRTAA